VASTPPTIEFEFSVYTPDQDGRNDDERAMFDLLGSERLAGCACQCDTRRTDHGLVHI
jgi:hypothetical protein